jgi:hypothetical protein
MEETAEPYAARLGQCIPDNAGFCLGWFCLVICHGSIGFRRNLSQLGVNVADSRVLGEFLFMQQLASEKVHCSVNSMNSC